MVGFGSSLRMSRRRGWEDAYLDYASLRLLLTQIEAVYEEEDWKRVEKAEQNGVNGEAADDDDDEGANDGVNALENVWKKTQQLVLGLLKGEDHRQQIGIRSHFQTHDQQRHMAHNQWWGGDGEENYFHQSEPSGSSWVSNYFDSPSEKRSRKRAREHKRTSKRALDKGGWRSPGVTDYRDELFLESDDDVAFGFADDEEDTDDSGDYYGGYGEYYKNYSGLEGGDQAYDERGNSIAGETHLDATDTNNGEGETGGQVLFGDCFSPERENNNSYFTESNAFGFSNGMMSPNETGSHQPSNSNDAVFHSDSPGVLETLDAAAIRKEKKNDDKIDFFVGSTTPPTRGVFDFISDIFSGWKQSPLSSSSGTKKAFNGISGEQQRLLNSTDFPHHPRFNTNTDSPYQYTHFSESFFPDRKNQSLQFQSSNQPSDQTKSKIAPPLVPLEDSDSPPNHLHFLPESTNSNLFQKDGSTKNPTEGVETPSFCPIHETPKTTPRKSAPVTASALGSHMPLTPMTPLSPVQEGRPRGQADNDRVEEFLHSVSMFGRDCREQGNGTYDSRFGGANRFGVSLKVDPRSVLMGTNTENDTPLGSDNHVLSPYGGGSLENNRGYRHYQPQNVDTEQSAFFQPHPSSIMSANNKQYQLRTPSQGGRDCHQSGFTSPQYYSLQNRHGEVSQNQYQNTLIPSLTSLKRAKSDDSGNFILNFLFGKSDTKNMKLQNNPGNKIKLTQKSATPRIQGNNNNFALPNHRLNSPNDQYDPGSELKRPGSNGAKRKRKRAKKRRRLSRAKCIPEHIRVAHERAAAITERFQGLLQAEVEKVILFTNSRLGELSDTLGSLRFASEDGGDEVSRKYPNLVDSGIHPCSSSDDDEGCDLLSSCASSTSEGNAQNQIDDDLDDIEHICNRPRPMKNESAEKEASTRRQIMLRERLRMSRPLFQKADFLGEDFSLLSAVDEADAYTAVGLELMHLLKFICVNIIAIRKICKKHDRLLANRMLGGYYQHQKKENPRRLRYQGKKETNDVRRDLFQLTELQFGGPLSNPVCPQGSGGFLCGFYDAKIQHIANSTTMQTVSSSLAIALADFEASQSRITRLGRLESVAEKDDSSKVAKNSDTTQKEMPSPRSNSFGTRRIREVVRYQMSGHCFRGDDDSTVASQEDHRGDGNESTTSNISLTRLQFVVTSVFGLREAARSKKVPFEFYASRIFMLSTGPNVVGDGLDGCSRATLDLLCSYNPDACFLLDVDDLFFCLKKNDKEGIGGVMAATLAAGCGDVSNFRHVSKALSIKLHLRKPQEEEDVISPLVNTECQNILRLNSASMILYSINYYVLTPTATLYVGNLGSICPAAALIGAPIVSSILSALVHSWMLSKKNSFAKKHVDISVFRRPLIVAAACAFMGNLLLSYSLIKSSVAMALFGRLLVGFGSSEVINRHLIGVCYKMSPASVNIEVARLVKKTMVSSSLGLLFGALFDVRVRDISVPMLLTDTDVLLFQDISSANITTSFSNQTNITTSVFNSTNIATSFSNSTQINLQPFPLNPYPPPIGSVSFGNHRLFPLEYIGYVMSFLWIIQCLGLLFFFDVPDFASNKELIPDTNLGDDEFNRQQISDDEYSRSNSILSDEQPRPLEDGFGSAFSSTDKNLFAAGGQIGDTHGETFKKLQTMSRSDLKPRLHHSYAEGIKSVQRLIFSNIATPTTIALLFLCSITNEVLLSSCATITSRYFNWSGAWSGFFMGAVSCTIFPINALLSMDNNIIERNVIKTALWTGRYGLVLMTNYEALFLLIKDMFKGIKTWDTSTEYDGYFGIPQYMLSFTIVFTSVVFLESSTLFLMSKVSPVQLRKYSFDNAFIVITVSALGKLVGDFLICVVDLSSWLFCYDIVNSLCFCLLSSFLVGSYVVRKHFFFLI